MDQENQMIIVIPFQNFCQAQFYEFYFALSGKLVGKEESYCHVNITINLLCIEKVFY